MADDVALNERVIMKWFRAKMTDGNSIDELRTEHAILRMAILESMASRGYGSLAYMPQSTLRAAHKRADSIAVIIHEVGAHL